MSKIYIVLQGKETGVFDNWADCEKNVKGFSGAKYKSFKNEAAIEENKEYSDFYFSGSSTVTKNNVSVTVKKISNDLSDDKYIYVDGACSGNPGLGEYQCVSLIDGNRKIIFGSEKYKKTTNNIMEFLALVEALKYNEKHDNSYLIYSDSVTAIAWVRNKKHKSSLKFSNTTEDSIDQLEEAENYLQSNTNYNFSKILKWDTKSRGEIPADFGRK